MLRGVRVSTVAREAEYAFVHPLVREVVYAGADPALHLAAADWLDTALGGRADHDVLVEYSPRSRRTLVPLQATLLHVWP